MQSSQLSFLAATLAYADIFDYPLTESEIHMWSIKNKTIPSSAFVSTKIVSQSKQYYFLAGRRAIIDRRKKRFKASQDKWIIAQRVGWWLHFVPTIQLAGVTGGLAMDNADPHDDIDIFIIAKRGTLWISRLLAVCIVGALGLRRSSGQTQVANKICLNMFLGDEALSIPGSRRDLFSAHEVLQMRPLWWRGAVYKSFLQKNAWVKYFLPNAWSQKIHIRHASIPVRDFPFGIACLRLFERLARLFQTWYMRRRRTTEVITDSVFRFHPRDARVWVKEALQKRLDLLGVPLDKIFYRG